MAYQPIESYGMIGDMRTVALVGLDGSIDWLCMPRFDSPSVLAALLDDSKGGRFRVQPTTEDFTSKQFYWPDTNVLVTRFLTERGSAELTDFMSLPGEQDEELCRRELVRRVKAQRGSIEFLLEFEPAFDYARAPHAVERVDGGAIFRGPGLTLGLFCDRPIQLAEGAATARFTLAEGETASITLREVRPGDEVTAPTTELLERCFHATVADWRRWLAQSRYRGRWREMVNRSALALKMLTYAPTGAIVAAPTCALPEGVGGVRNWDYRYTWIRDSAFTVYAFLRLGFHQEAHDFMAFVARLAEQETPGAGPLQIMYGIDGRSELAEEVLDHLDGYRGSRPVRVGNGAYRQLQLDIYGELLDSAYIYHKYAAPITYDFWCDLIRLVDWVCENWQRPDDGVWEVRGGAQDFLYSKLMCWVAVDRALRIAEMSSFPCDRVRWLGVRDSIYRTIMERGWNAERGAFTQAFGSTALDASNLMMPLTLFISPNDPRLLATLEATMQPASQGGLLADHLVYRYDVSRSVDGLAGTEGTFNICTFWLVEALTRSGRFHRPNLDSARLIFERMLGFANHLGLYSEETGMRGEALGNFPQAFTHLALISAAVNLDRGLGEGE